MEKLTDEELEKKISKRAEAKNGRKKIRDTIEKINKLSYRLRKYAHREARYKSSDEYYQCPLTKKKKDKLDLDTAIAWEADIIVRIICYMVEVRLEIEKANLKLPKDIEYLHMYLYTLNTLVNVLKLHQTRYYKLNNLLGTLMLNIYKLVQGLAILKGGENVY